MIVDFYRHFPDVELIVFQEVFNGVWDALADGRVELAIGATRSIPVGGRYAFRDMGMLSWDCVVASDHPLAKMEGPLSDDVLRNWPSLVREDTSPDAACCLTWQQSDASPALNWMLDYLGDSDTLNREWLRAPE